MELLGTPASPGIAIGRALVLTRATRPSVRLPIAPDRLSAELGRLRRAVELSRLQIQSIRERLALESGLPHAYIFDAHLLMLEDPLLLGQALALVRERHVNAEWALQSVAEELHRLFEGLADDYLRERSQDLDDVLGRIQLNLSGAADGLSIGRLPEAFVIVAESLSPSAVAELDWPHVLGVILAAGSATDHVAILARARGLPVVAAVERCLERVPPGAVVALDGAGGRILIEPSALALDDFRGAQQAAAARRRCWSLERDIPAATADGVRVILRANVEFPDDIDRVLSQGAEGVGLLRSEYLLPSGRSFPDEVRQLASYRAWLERLGDQPLTVRLLDLGPDELGSSGPSSPNPALGERGLRLARRERGPFQAQLRALLQAAASGRVRLLLPFVTDVGDLDFAFELIAAEQSRLRAAGLPCGQAELGVNIEVPAAALSAEALLRRVDFLTIGSNDLIQYLLAADRRDPRVAAWYQPWHPAVLRVLAELFELGRHQGRPVALCGELAAEPAGALLLVALGARELSMTPGAIPAVKAALRHSRCADLEVGLARCRALASAAEVERAWRELLSAIPGQLPTKE